MLGDIPAVLLRCLHCLEPQDQQVARLCHPSRQEAIEGFRQGPQLPLVSAAHAARAGLLENRGQIMRRYRLKFRLARVLPIGGTPSLALKGSQVLPHASQTRAQKLSWAKACHHMWVCANCSEGTAIAKILLARIT